MVSKGELATIALRYDTAMSRAMLRALGLSFSYRHVMAGHRRRERRPAQVYDGIQECFENRMHVNF